MRKLRFLFNGFSCLAVMLLFSQCNGKNNEHNGTSQSAPVAVAGVKMAYVDIDTLLTNYNFWKDLNEAMVKKSENVRLTLNQKAADLDKQKQEFQTKYQNNAFLSAERAQQEYNRIAKLEQDLQVLSNQLQNELASENEKNSLQLRDSIKSFLKSYNKEKGYTMIFSNTGMDNLLYADESYDITKDIIEGLNSRYAGPKKTDNSSNTSEKK